MRPSPTQDELQQVRLRVREPDWGEREPNNLTESHDKIRATWLGHACFLVEFPPRQQTTPEDRGIRILFDPVFSDRCSPTQYMGPKRYTRKGYVTLSNLFIKRKRFFSPALQDWRSSRDRRCCDFSKHFLALCIHWFPTILMAPLA